MREIRSLEDRVDVGVRVHLISRAHDRVYEVYELARSPRLGISERLDAHDFRPPLDRCALTLALPPLSSEVTHD